MIFSVLLTVLLVHSTKCSSVTDQGQHYVVPSLSLCPSENNCITLDALLHTTSKYLTSNTVVKFMTGDYMINTSMKTQITIKNVRNLTLAGYSERGIHLRNGERAIFHCLGSFNIFIINSINVQLSNIEFLQCRSNIASNTSINTDINGILSLSDQLRQEFYNIFQDLELKSLAQAATVYIVNSSSIALDNVKIKDLPNGIALLSINIQRSFTIQRSYFEGGVRIWSLEDYNGRLTTRGSIRYTITHTQFHSTIANNYRQDALTLISDTPVNIHLAMTNTTITSKSKQFRKGYILHIIMANMNNFIIDLEELQFYHGKTFINIHDDKNYDPRRSSTIILQKGKFYQSAFHAQIDHRKSIILIENSSFEHPIESLYITASGNQGREDIIAYLRNIIIHRCVGFPAIFLLKSTVYFEEQNKISFCELTEGIESAGSDSAYFTGGLLSLDSQVTFRGETTINNNKGEEGAAIQAHERSHLYMEGEITFKDNTAFNGGALSFYEDSWMTIKHTTSMNFIRNHADNFGGAIYVGDEEKDSKDQFSLNKLCFYEPANLTSNYDYRLITFSNNTANQAGDIIYAPNGEYARCVFPTYKKYNKYTGFTIEKAFIKQIDYYTTNMSLFSSKPRQVCFCTNSVTNCSPSFSIQSRQYYPGQEFNVSAVAIGVSYGSTPAFVEARIVQNKVKSFLSKLQQKQETYKTCTSLTYTMHSIPGVYKLILSLNYVTLKSAIEAYKLRKKKDMDISTSIYSFPLVLSVTIKHCPKGFEFSNKTLVCICHHHLTEHDIGCNINTQTIQRRSTYWIYPARDNVKNASSVILHMYCPYDYCNPQALHINLANADEQCSHKRSGVLCGSCQANQSMVLGSNRCRQCSNARAPLIIFVSLLAGFLLVILLTVLNMTVSIGTVNGLILYANILQPNTAVLFSSGTLHFTQFLRIFIAWLNLDIGIEMCFYDGLDAFVKVLLQLVFPAYIWAIMIFIIVGSHYSTKIAKISGTNSVQVLATLFLLSYTKILRVIITAFSATSLKYPNYTKLTWLQDGNVNYLQEKHAFLFFLALLLLFGLSLPYTAILLLSQCLQRWSNYPLISWIWKVKPLFDAYTGPLKDNHRYWTGLLLLFRVILYTVYSTNVGGNPATNILATAIMVACLLTYITLIGGMYKSWSLTALECSYLLNLLILTVLTLYSSERQQETYTVTLVMMAFLVTCITIGFHIFLKIKAIKCVNTYLQKWKQNTETEEDDYPQPTPPIPMEVTSQLIYFSRKDMKEPLLICDGEDITQQ